MPVDIPNSPPVTPPETRVVPEETRGRSQGRRSREATAGTGQAQGQGRTSRASGGTRSTSPAPSETSQRSRAASAGSDLDRVERRQGAAQATDTPAAADVGGPAMTAQPQQTRRMALLKRMFPNPIRSALVRVLAVGLAGVLIAGAVSLFLNPVTASVGLGVVFCLLATGITAGTLGFTWKALQNARQQMQEESDINNPDVDVRNHNDKQRLVQTPRDMTADTTGLPNQDDAVRAHADANGPLPLSPTGVGGRLQPGGPAVSPPTGVHGVPAGNPGVHNT